jgi:death-on-curing protein
LPSEPRWLTADHAIRLNERAVAVTGEPFQVRDIGLLESAMANPINHWHYGERSLAKLAALLLLAVARNHAFAQGNKRVGLLAADAFLAINGYRLNHPDQGFADLILGALTREIDETDFLHRFAGSVTAPAPVPLKPRTAMGGTLKAPKHPGRPAE